MEIFILKSTWEQRCSPKFERFITCHRKCATLLPFLFETFVTTHLSFLFSIRDDGAETIEAILLHVDFLNSTASSLTVFLEIDR
jgi:hypothetical protein